MSGMDLVVDRQLQPHDAQSAVGRFVSDVHTGRRGHYVNCAFLM
jgi:hypothetical protein